MRANRDDQEKPEPHTLIKFANPYFKDASSVVSCAFQPVHVSLYFNCR